MDDRRGSSIDIWIFSGPNVYSELESISSPFPHVVLWLPLQQPRPLTCRVDFSVYSYYSITHYLQTYCVVDAYYEKCFVYSFKSLQSWAKQVNFFYTWYSGKIITP